MTNWWYFSYFSQKTAFDMSYKLSLLETICMKCQILFLGKIRKVFQNVVCWNFYSECWALIFHCQMEWIILFIPGSYLPESSSSFLVLLTHFGLNKLPLHYILKESNFNFRYARLCDLYIPRDKWLNYLQTLETLIRLGILWHLIRVCTVCHLPFWGSPG